MSVLSQFFGGGGGGIGDPVPDTMKVVEILLVGGGGAGGGSQPPTTNLKAGGGGAGEMVEVYNLVVANGDTYPITIGGGGSGSPGAVGNPGSSSSFSNTIIASGGGGGGSGDYDGRSTLGGSGGGAGSYAGAPTVGGDASIKYSIAQNVFDVITSINSFCTPGSGYTIQTQGAGYGGGALDCYGTGKSNSITGSPVTYAEGGVLSTDNPGPAGGANTGSGGDSTNTNSGTGGAGGSGVCIIRWPTAYPAASSVSGNTPTPAQPGYHVYRWNGDGSITF